MLLIAVAVEKEGQNVAHLNQEKSGCFGKIILYYLLAKHGNTCQVQVRGKRVNLGVWKPLQVPCTLQFSEEEKYINC